MSENILFQAKKHCRFGEGLPKPALSGGWGGWGGTLDSEVTMTREKLIIKPKKHKKAPITIYINEIEEIIKEELKSRILYCTKLFLRNGTRFYIRFAGSLISSDNLQSLNNNFFNTLKVQVDRVKKQKELEELKKIQKPTNIFYINIPPQTKLTALRCPSCQAPLEYIPPCKCEHCGVMIELMK